ncbi:MAG TPA: chromosome partitioning protein ParB, partial [Desulfobacterales bacterium]|nr:chromosome partitioning protein ParB [Desulfobacterales bacterium]
MVDQVEISSFDLRYEGFRMKSPGAEKALLLSILEKGIRDPLQGVDTEGARILLDGFKRLRCARRLGIDIAPYVSMGADEVLGIIELIRISN